LISASLDERGVIASAFFLKIIFTALSIGTGFMGGETVPLFVIGTTFGHVLGQALGMDVTLAAALGFVALFGAASNTPLACVLIGVELFSSGGIVYMAVATFTAYIASGHRSIYETQRITTAKSPDLYMRGGESMESLHQTRSASRTDR
jgi:H+/Cl- antiporter ClcA